MYPDLDRNYAPSRNYTLRAAPTINMDPSDVTAGDRSTLLRHAKIISAFGVAASATEPLRERTPYKNEVTT
jgi:hypothetical protein